jgi:hypothetical protein
VSSEPKLVPAAAIGFRVKSGWATAVLLTGPFQSPRILDQRIVELSDPQIPESRQPHHAGMGTLETDDVKVSRRVEIVRHCTRESVTQLLNDYRTRNCKVGSSALAVGSIIDPSTIRNPHIRAHALEGRLFRTVLEETLGEFGLSCCLVVERRAYIEAAAVLALTEGELKRTVSNLGAVQSGHWRADQKMAALVAWMALAGSHAVG